MRALCTSLLLATACGTGPLPEARIDLRPSSLCEGDTERAVTLGAGRSLGGDGSSDGLRYAWSVSMEPTETVRGSSDEEEWVVRFDARHAVKVDLAVTDADGRVGTREKLLTLVRTEPTDCAAGCAAKQICVPVAGASRCVADRVCTDDAECGCLRCQSDDLGEFRCLP